MTATASRPTRLETVVARRIGRNTRVGSVAPCWARYMKMVTGSRVSDELLSTRNRICALVAVFFCGLSSCSECMALMPIGVAALSRPRILAAKFMLICPSAGWPLGTSGIRRRNRGSSTRASRRISPAFSAMARNPSHRVMVPTSTRMISTLSRAMSNRAATSRLNTSLSPTPSHCQRAARKAGRKKLSQIPLSMGKQILLGQVVDWLGQVGEADDLGKAAGDQRSKNSRGFRIRLAIIPGRTEAHLEGGNDIAGGIGLPGLSRQTVAKAPQGHLEPGQRRRLASQQMLVMRHARRVRPDSHARLGQLLPGEQRPRVELALRCDITVADDPLRRQAVALQNILEQGNQLVDLVLIPGVPLPPLGGIAVARMYDLNTDGTGVQPGAPLPAAIPGMPGAA